VLALLAMLLGSLSLVVGYHTRHGAMLLFGLTVIASVLTHAYWTLTDPVTRAADYEIFIRNVAIAGGLLLLVGMGPGPFAFDNAGQKRR
jgi:putative oxidoreductase